MKIKTKSIDELKREFGWDETDGRLCLDGCELCIPPQMKHIMGKVIEVERDNLKIGYIPIKGYVYKSEYETWRIFDEWVHPLIDDEIDGMFSDMLEDL